MCQIYARLMAAKVASTSHPVLVPSEFVVLYTESTPSPAHTLRQALHGVHSLHR